MDTLLKIECLAYAKINLNLRVLGRREDGYHEICTVIQRISLADKLALTRLENSVIYRGPAVTDDTSDNLCVKAARAFQGQLGYSYGVMIELEKSIPSGAGLGGGSSDAAAVVNGMAELYGISRDDARLTKAANSVGSDVAFFQSGMSSALARGRGDVLSPHSALSDDQWVLILWRGIRISTAEMYDLLDDSLTKDENKVKLDLRKSKGDSPAESTVTAGNDFEKLVFDIYPELREARDRLTASGAKIAALTGSGSALFAVYDSEAVTRAAAEIWRPPWLSFVCRPC